MPSSLHMAAFKLLQCTVREACPLVSGADRSGHHQEFHSGVRVPEAWVGGDSYMRKACLQLNECSHTGYGHPSQGCGWSANAPQSVFNDG